MFFRLDNRSLFWLGAFLFALSAWYTVGYHHADEHFQILEFAKYRLGESSPVHLPWEFGAQMRPGLQPMLVAGWLRAARALGITDPFLQVFVLRWAIGMATLWAYWRWCERAERDFASPSTARLLRLGFLLFWAMPYLAVRFSSENASATAFFAGLYFLLQSLDNQKVGQKKQLWAAGFLLALSFFFRFQIAFAGLGLGAWLVFQRRLTAREWLPLLCGAALGGGLGALADTWFYGTWALTPYNYFFQNIVAGKAAAFGVSPPWYYLSESLLALLPPMSLLLIALFFKGLSLKIHHALAWCIVPFLLAHSLIGHKEFRFVFPMALPFLYLAAVGWEQWGAKIWSRRWARRSIRAGLAINFFALAVRTFSPAIDSFCYLRFFCRYTAAQPCKIYFEGKSPWNRAGLEMNFFKTPSAQPIALYRLAQINTLHPSIAPAEGDLILVNKNNESLEIQGFNRKKVYSFLPEIVLQNNFNDWQSRSNLWQVYRLEHR
jgi:phosphatidylinositol glycan class B